MARTVTSVAKAAGISVRTLHHYDEVGLLKPSRVGANGYRYYSCEDVERLQLILVLKKLELSLEDIRTLLQTPGFDRRAALENQLLLLKERRRQTGVLIRTLRHTLKRTTGEAAMKDEELFEGLQEGTQQEEARGRWGNTPAWKESQRRSRGYSKEDWGAIRAEGKAAAEGVAAHMEKGPESVEVQRFVRAHHQHINDRFYTCSAEMYDRLAQMWVEDPRFTQYWDAIRPGLAAFMRQAVEVYVYDLLLQDERR
ncbi:MAG: MerR family transcriptional regulator [Deltaproteobacteria bacterium]|nr:MerR family transcriptional regulator [Deltaproteobacteria bacterium]